MVQHPSSRIGNHFDSFGKAFEHARASRGDVTEEEDELGASFDRAGTRMAYAAG
jgi:hypothetical protein